MTLYGTRLRRDVLLFYLTAVVSSGVVIPYTSKDGFSRHQITMTLLGVVFGLIYLVTIAMTVTLVASLMSRITKLGIENARLFDKMHEGIVVVAK